MSRQQKLHKPIKGDFNSILATVAMGEGKSKRMGHKAAKARAVEKTKGK